MLTLYNVFCDGVPILLQAPVEGFDYTDAQFSALSANLEMEDCKSGSLTFSISPDNCAYDKINIMKSVIKVVEYTYNCEALNEKKILWKGRAVSVNEDINSIRTYTCEGALAFLGDILESGKGYNTSSIGTNEDGADLCSKYLDFLLNHEITSGNEYGNYDSNTNFILDLGSKYNHKVSPDHHIYVGDCDVCPTIAYEAHTDHGPGGEPCDYWGLSSCTGKMQSTLDRIMDTLVEPSGGHLNIRHEIEDGEEVMYLDYLEGYYENEDPASAKYGENIITINKNIELENPITALLARGKTETHTSSVKNGESTRLIDITDYCSIGYHAEQDGMFIVDDGLVEKYGRIEGIMDFPDIEDPKALYKKAQWWLRKQQFANLSFEITAVDLGRINESERVPIHLLDQIHVISEKNGIDDYFPVVKIEIDLLNPANTVITVNRSNGVSVSANVSGQAKISDKTRYQTTATRDLLGSLMGDPLKEIEAEYSSYFWINQSEYIHKSATAAIREKYEYDVNKIETAIVSNFPALANTADAYNSFAAFDIDTRIRKPDMYLDTTEITRYLSGNIKKSSTNGIIYDSEISRIRTYAPFVAQSITSSTDTQYCGKLSTVYAVFIGNLNGSSYLARAYLSFGSLAGSSFNFVNADGVSEPIVFKNNVSVMDYADCWEKIMTDSNNLSYLSSNKTAKRFFTQTCPSAWFPCVYFDYDDKIGRAWFGCCYHIPYPVYQGVDKFINVACGEIQSESLTKIPCRVLCSPVVAHLFPLSIQLSRNYLYVFTDSEYQNRFCGDVTKKYGTSV